MFFAKSLLLFVCISTAFVGKSLGANKHPYVHPDHAFDQELYQSVLDPELCAKQLQYIRYEDLLLRLEFLGSGSRLPRNIALGSFMDFGNFRQCLSINKEVGEMIIQGKHCLIDVPLDFTLMLSENYDNNQTRDELIRFSYENYTQLMGKINKQKQLLLARQGIISDNRMLPGSPGFMLLSMCIPQSCDVYDALGNSIFNINGILQRNVHQLACRLPNDKLFVAADYTAWAIFGLLGLITAFSTMYDVRHTLILKKDPKSANEFYSAFSIYKNSCKLINLKTRPGTLECVDGVRSLSIMWVIVGHSFMMGTFYPANPLDIYDWYDSGKSIWMKTAPLAVDTFFLLSGLLVVYTTASKFTAMKFLKNLHLFYLHRYLRLLPVLAAVILYISSIQFHFGDGPQWHLPAVEAEACRTNWWITLLHMQNFVKPDYGCLDESWYLAIDMHLHILSPIVLFWVFSGAKKPAWIGVVSTFVISLTASTVFIFLTEFSEEGLDYHYYYYVNILTRAPPFFVGCIYGFLLHTFRDKKCGLSKVLGYSITAFVLGLTALVLYCSHIHISGDISLTIVNVFLSFERTAWAICVGWIIFACVNGYAGPINWFLSMSVWKIPSRISYSMYLIHMTAMMFSYHASLPTPTYFSVPSFLFDFVAFLYLTMFVSFFVTAMIDLPFATLFRILLTGGNKTQGKTEKPVSNPENGVKVEE